jgi:hypothetical protein
LQTDLGPSLTWQLAFSDVRPLGEALFSDFTYNGSVGYLQPQPRNVVLLECDLSGELSGSRVTSAHNNPGFTVNDFFDKLYEVTLIVPPDDSTLLVLLGRLVADGYFGHESMLGRLRRVSHQQIRRLGDWSEQHADF